MHKFLVSGIAFLLIFNITCAQSVIPNDSIKRQAPVLNWKRTLVAPAILISAGLIATTDNEVFDRYEVHEARTKLMPNFRTHIDDYMAFMPIAAVYGLNALGVKGQHDIANQTALLIKSEIIMNALVFPLKKITHVARPTGEPNSFPSGHTAEAFVAATFLHKEYGKDHPLYSVLAYSTATGVGILRVMNNRHWMSDVLVGAGIGIFSTNLAYMTHQNKWGKKHKRLSGSVILPTYSQKSFGVSMVLPIR